MNRARAPWTMTASVLLTLAALDALGACKKKTEAPAPAASLVSASDTVANAPAVVAPLIPSVEPPAAGPSATAGAPVLGDVKRFPDKEKTATGAVQVAIDDSKVYDEPDATKPAVTTLSKELFVVRLATLGADWVLVNFPAGIGKLSPGWVEAKSLTGPVTALSKVAVAARPSASAAASAKPAASAVPAATAVASATPAPAASVVVRKPGAILKRPR